MSDKHLNVENLSYHYYGQDNLLSSVNLELVSGQILQIMGSNGSGKSTLLKLIAGLKSLEHGKVTLGADVTFHFLGHENGLKEILTPVENLLLYNNDRDACEKALTVFGLEAECHNKECFLLSAGQKRKTALSRFALADDKVWIMDEPFTALDDASKKKLKNILLDHVKNGGSAIAATHEHLGFKNSVLKEVRL
jgi:heme exporter protein A